MVNCKIWPVKLISAPLVASAAVCSEEMGLQFLNYCFIAPIECEVKSWVLVLLCSITL